MSCRNPEKRTYRRWSDADRVAAVLRRKTRTDPETASIIVYPCELHWHIGHDPIRPLRDDVPARHLPPHLTHRLPLPGWVLRLAEGAPSTP